MKSADGIAAGMGEGEMMEVLVGVSRSFVLTIRALPRAVRRPIGLAYLLARVSDTMADTASAPIDVRVECLRGFAERVAGRSEGSFGRVKEIVPESEAERYLMGNVERVLGAMEGLDATDRGEVVTLLEKITRGQELDLLRFPDSTRVRALETTAELTEYTYLVAGCVGEFWTRVCGAHLPRYGRVGMAELCELGRGFGMGLQLVNILRDVPEDLRNGRCYLPMEELRKIGVGDPNELRVDARRAGPVFEEWRRVALGRCEEGRRYIMGIRPWRIRYGCLLPWALGVRTLGMIGGAAVLGGGARVKVGRKEMRGIAAKAVVGAVSNGVVRRWGKGGDC